VRNLTVANDARFQVMTNRHDRIAPRRWASIYCLVVIGSVLIGVVVRSSPATDEPPRTPARWAAQSTPATARVRLTRLTTTEPAWEVAYDRIRDFGPAWADVDHNGCDTRNDILHRDLSAPTFRLGTDRCVVLTGSMIDPYTGATMHFVKADANAVQIDHVVPLHAAWILGAWRWTPARRLAFANDPRNLVAVDGPSNQRKSDRLADHWRPENPAILCVYAINTVAVHSAYRLAVTGSERRALHRLLDRCP
jgi:hypothetical protein